MAASTAWAVQIKMMTASNAPKMFAELAKAANKSGTAVEGLERKVKAFAKAIESARFTRAFAKISNGFTGIEKSSDNFAKKMNATANTSILELDRISGGMGKVDAAFRMSGRYAGSFARTVGVVSRASSAELGGVSSSLNVVRSNAYAAAGAVRTLASAARSVPRNIHVSAGGGGAGGSFSGGPGAGTFALAGAGMAAGGGLLSGIRGAADLQTAMVGIRNATGATPQQMDMLQQQAYSLSALTAQSVGDSAHIMAVMARSGMNDPNQLMKISKPAALFADVQFLSRGVPFEEGAKNAIMLAHLFHAYNPADATKMFDQMTRLSEMMPDNLSKAVTQMGYFVPQLKALGVPNEQNIALMALLDRVGYGRGKGGTGVAALVMNALGPLQLTKHAQVGKNDLLRQIGVLGASGQSLFYDKKTQSFDMIGFLHQLGKYGATHDRADTVKNFKGAFGTGGGRIADMATDRNFIDQLNKIISFMGRTDLSMIEQQKRYMNTLNGQFQLFTTNFKSFLTDMMWPWLDRLRDTFHFLGDKIHDTQQWMHQHPTARKAAGIGLAGLAAAGTVASLAIGGYIASGALHWATGGLFKGIGAHAAANAISGTKVANRLGGLGGLFKGAGQEAGWFPGQVGRFGKWVGSGIGKVAGKLDPFGGQFFDPAAWRPVTAFLGRFSMILGRLAPILARLGLRFLGVVGWVSLAIDALKFFQQHPKEIGKWVGSIVGWLRHHLWPDTVKVITSMGKGIVGAFVGMLTDMWDMIKHPERWGKAWSDFSKAESAADAAQDPNQQRYLANQRAKHAHAHGASAASGGYTRGEGLTYLHKNELVVNDKLTRKLERMTSGGGTHTVRHEIALSGSGIPSNPSDLRKLAHMIADILSVDVAYDSRAGGSIPQMSGHSFFDIAQGMPA